MTRLRAWLLLTRGANLPTVVSNLLLGWLAAIALGGNLDGSSLGALLGAALGVVLLYAAGMLLNDAADSDWDRTHRPERPIPQGILTGHEVRWVGVVGLGLGLGCLSLGSPRLLLTGFVLVGFILAYTRWHKTQPSAAPWLMGACRALLPIMGWLLADTTGFNPIIFVHSLALFLATAGISLLAQHESLASRPTLLASAPAGLACLLLPGYLFTIGIVSWPVVIWTAGLSVGLTWTAKQVANIGQRVGLRIAGLVLLDYQLWLAIRPSFQPTDPLVMGGLALLLLFASTLALRRLLPST